MTVLRRVNITDIHSPYKTAEVEPNGGLAVNLQDQTSPVLIIPFHKLSNETTLATGAAAKDDLTIDVAVTTGFVAGAYITIYNIAGNRWYQGFQVGAVAGSTVTLDTPIDFEYQVGDKVAASDADMNVDGSATTQTFTLREPATSGLTLTGDCTRLIFVMTCASSLSWAEFGDLAALTNGLVLRKVDGTYQNIFNVKSNKDFASIMYDFDIFIAGGPTGIDGCKGRLTFGGQNKLGVVVRIEDGEDLQLLVQDNLSGLTSFRAYAEGHITVTAD